jgi:hypothetical protein
VITTLSLKVLMVLQEQLGYIVFSGLRRSNGVQGLRFIVQSEKHPVYLGKGLSYRIGLIFS